MNYYGYETDDIITTVADKKNTIISLGYPEDRIAETDVKIDFEQGQWKHTENGPELVD